MAIGISILWKDPPFLMGKSTISMDMSGSKKGDQPEMGPNCSSHHFSDPRHMAMVFQWNLSEISWRNLHGA